MPFCPACRSEYRPDFDRCQDCDCDLVDSLPDAPAPPPGDLKHLYSTTLLEEAETLRIMLEDSGIRASIANQGGALYAVGIPTPAAPLRIMVPETDAEKAKEILEDHFRILGKKPEDSPFQKKLEGSRSTVRRLWLLTWLAPPALTLALTPFGGMEPLLLGGTYFLGIGLVAWKLGAFESGKKPDQ